MTNVKFVSDLDPRGIETRVDPTDDKGRARVLRELAEYRAEEPSANWRLETRGEQCPFWRPWVA
jgi:hypothetical protein